MNPQLNTLYPFKPKPNWPGPGPLAPESRLEKKQLRGKNLQMSLEQ